MRFKKSAISAIIILVALATMIAMSGLNFLIPETRNYEAEYSATKSASSEELPSSTGQARYEAGSEERGNNMEKFFLKTKDNIKIVANFYPVGEPIGWLVLTHMMPATKESWQDFAKELQHRGYESIAIDLRGHGESGLGPDGYKNFSNVDHQKSILDLEVAVDYLVKNRGAVPEKIYFIGASIGANLSLQYISERPEFKTAVLLSPGLNYRGIETEPLVKNLKAKQKVLFVSSRDDGSNTEENQTLYNAIPKGVIKDLVIYQAAGHGTNMFNKEEPDLTEVIFKFIQ